ncbi:RWD domain-containing protein, putative [Plasmodium vinckei brucechwatti]|uniref:RWD domain-containing protein, putative n=1 Tax=Plasmodium vinckei brucechwatti TaxID=119398 RepID=A0A6V7RZM3_PLAVN|nr:RWD domain-containing protein, putative [Plasmodium vinckei brucechwatti]
MDYKSEQATEKESLSLLYEYTNEFININDNSFKILIDNKNRKQSFYVQFEYTETYPNEPPIYKIVDGKNISETLKANIEQQIKETIENNLGYTMIYNIVENIRTYILEEVEEKSMYDEMLERQLKSNEIDINKEIDETTNEIANENVLEVKELCEEKYRVTEEEFNAWRKEFYKDYLPENKNMNNADNPTGKELFEKGKFDLTEADFEDGEAKWCNEELFCEIDLNI